MEQIQTYFTDDDTEKGFSTLLKTMFNNLDTTQHTNFDENVRKQFIGSAQSLATYFNGVATNLQELQGTLNNEIKSTVDNVNSIAEKIALINKQINQVEINGGHANELRDKRALLVDELSAIVPVEISEVPITNSNYPDMDLGINKYTVKINGQTMVDGYDYRTLSYEAREQKINQTDIDGLYDLTWSDTGVKFNAASASMGGSLRALFEMRDGNNAENFTGKIGTEAGSIQNTVVDGRTVTQITVKNPSMTDVEKLSIAEQGIKGAAGDLDRTVPIDRVDARADIVEGAAADLTAGDRQSAVFAKLTAGNISIGDLDIAVDRHIAQRAEVEVCTALIQDLQSAFIAAVVGVAVISPAVAHVNTVQICVRVQAVHIGHAGQVGQTLTGKAQFLVHGQDLNQLHGGIVRKRKRTEAGRERFAVCTDGDRGNCHAAVCKTVIRGACGQSHDTAAGRGYRPRTAADIAFHHQLQIVPVTGIAILLDEIDIPGFLPAVQGAVLRQDQLVCLPLRVGAQAGDIAEKAAPDIAAILGQLIVGATVNGAPIQHHIGVAAAQNVDAVHIASFYQKCTGDSAIQQINRVTISILDGHIAADRAVQNVLGIFTAGTGDGQPGSFVKAPAGTGCCLGQTVRTGLDLDHLIICFRVRANILILVFRAISDAVGLFRRYGRRPRPCICKCGYRENGEHHTECQYHAHDAFFHDILSFVG